MVPHGQRVAICFPQAILPFLLVLSPFLLADGAPFYASVISDYPPLHSLSISTTSHGFTAPARGWNSFGMQANPEINPSWRFDQEHILEQCDALIGPLSELGYIYCSVDSGWSVGDHGDKHGRIIWDKRLFDIPALADHLHARGMSHARYLAPNTNRVGLRLGLYVVPGAFIADASKTIFGTDITIADACSGDNGLGRCNWNFTLDGPQQWHDSVVQQFADWYVGTDQIRRATYSSIY